MYEEKKTFDVLKGTVPDFSTKDINLAFTIDGETQTNIKFPNKGEGYIVENVDCEDNVTADWNSSTWSLENIDNKGTAKKVKCTVKFKTSQGEPILNGADPVLGEGMIPVKIGDKGVVTKVKPESGDWYSYEDKEWANAVILNEGVEEPGEGEKIEETDIESYFVWIPKYSYRLFDIQLGNYTGLTNLQSKNNFIIKIKFGLDNTIDNDYECATPMRDNGVQGASGESGTCEVGDYITPSAFLAFGGNGFWVGKFETSDNNGIQIKPNKNAWRYISVKDAFNNAKAYKGNLKSHMMKNTERGAIVYLTQSIYGRCDETKNTCTEVAFNNSHTTGYSGNTAYGGLDSAQSASTTGNYSGVYDLAGGSWEYMASVISSKADAEIPAYGSSGFDDASFPKDKEYFDLYGYNTSSTNYTNRILGDATGELGPFGLDSGRPYSSYYSDLAFFPVVNSSWFRTAGIGTDTYLIGIGGFTTNQGAGSKEESFRVVLAPQ